MDAKDAAIRWAINPDFPRKIFTIKPNLICDRTYSRCEDCAFAIEYGLGEGGGVFDLNAVICQGCCSRAIVCQTTIKFLTFRPASLITKEQFKKRRIHIWLVFRA